MKKYIFLIFIISAGFIACNNAYEKEIAEVQGLMKMVDEMEKSILSVDTSKAFTAKRNIASDIKTIEDLVDTLDRETAFRLDDLFSGKKKIYRFQENYNSILNQIKFAKNQLDNLKQDLSNGLIDKDTFGKYYSTEHASIIDLNMQVNKSVTGIDEIVQQYELNREEIKQLINELAQKSANNN